MIVSSNAGANMMMFAKKVYKLYFCKYIYILAKKLKTVLFNF